MYVCVRATQKDSQRAQFKNEVDLGLDAKRSAHMGVESCGCMGHHDHLSVNRMSSSPVLPGLREDSTDKTCVAIPDLSGSCVAAAQFGSVTVRAWRVSSDSGFGSHGFSGEGVSLYFSAD